MKIVIIADVSGSVERLRLDAIVTHTMNALEASDNEVWVVFADHEVRAVLRPKHIRRQSFDLNLIGHGGTDMGAVRYQVMKTMKPDFVVTVSDGMY
jgi:predicted metal-dependent peptidase